jgi:gliding motility associated protien GldN
MKNVIFVLILFIGCISLAPKDSLAQGGVMDKPRDGVYDKNETATKNPVPYAPLREADVFWSKRIWRTINMKEKFNLPFYYPAEPTNGRYSLMQIIFSAIEGGELDVYDPSNDDFTLPYTYEQLLEKTSSVDTLTVTRPYPPYETYDTVVENELELSTIYEFRIKEDWFFDKQRSVLDVRILGICPVIERYSSYFEFLGVEPMFWIYFPQARNVLAKFDQYNRFNDAARLSYEDVFFKRMFSSYIYKESNVYDRVISEYQLGINALLEAERIEEDIRVYEHDLWEY